MGLSCCFIYDNHVWSSIFDHVVRFNLNIPENFKRLIFCTRFLFIPFLGNIKVFLSTNISMHRLSHPVMLSFVFFLKKFRTIKNNVGNCSIAGFTHPAFGIISSTTYLRFDFVSFNALVLSLVISDSVSL